MSGRSDSGDNPSSLRDKIIGLGERSLRKSYYPQLRQQLEETEESRSRLEERSVALQNMLADLEAARSSLADSEARYRTLVENINDVIFSLDIQGKITYVSPVVQNLSKLAPEQIVGRSFKEFVHPDDRSAVVASFERVLTGHPGTQEFRFVSKDGGIRHVRTSNRPLVENGRVVGLTGVMSDITERRLAEEEILKLNQELEQRVAERTAQLEAANKAKSLFLANMSHELRTPLNAILGFSGMMRRNPKLSDNQAESLDIINRSGEHLLALINDVLEMSKIEAGRVKLEIAPFDLGGMVRDVADMMRLRAEEKGLQLLFDQSSEFPRHIRGDEARLRQILVNLVGNAVKFTKEGSVTIRLGVKQNHRQHLLMEIEDTGPGISAEDQQRIFQPFVQLAEGAEQKGTGLGLAITRQFVDLMGGNIAVESTLGKGSLFRVELPVELVGAADIPAAMREEVREVVGLAPGQTTCRILIAEDQPENQLLLTQLMKDIGLETRGAENGEQCVQVFQDWRPDLIWMDRRMPVMDGLEATRRIRQLPGGDTVKIVAVTASAFKEQQQEMLAAGMDDFVPKPYRFSEIYDSLSRQLGLKYVYRSDSTEAQVTPVALTPAMMAGLPADLRQELRVALERLESERITALIEQVAAIDAQLGSALSRLADGFDYPAMLHILHEADS